MKKQLLFFCYSLLFAFIIIADRITKYFVLMYITDRYEVNQFLSFDLTLNRGIAWGIFYSQDNYIFAVVSIVIALITVGLAIYTYFRWRNQQCILGEICVIAGSCSNLIDRILYGGVIDFILLEVANWSWPVFNVADACIVVGVGVMLLEYFGSIDN